MWVRPGAYPERCFTQVGSGLIRLERLDRDKHSSLLQKSVNYGRIMFHSLGPRSLFDKTVVKFKFIEFSSLSNGFKARPGNTKGGKYYCTADLLFDWFGY